ncbi:hypothetical protein M885DRAFT_555194 [Pelagophyceae sp. CCMP2097]|nr:hypothetical protein M885DRAFT_555194 [Pelagophyceae sp. CCMP2097]
MLRVGDGDAPPGLELGLRQLQNGTRLIVRAEPRFAYGDQGRPASLDEGTLAVPPDACVEWTLEAHRLWYRDGDELPPQAQLLDARNKKELGNEHFHHEVWAKAGHNYQEILKTLNVWNFEEGSADRTEAEAIYVDCGNNLVFALQRMGEWLKAEKAIVDVLTVAPHSQKALYRAGQIALHLSKWEEATAAISAGLELWPKSRDFRDLYEQLRQDKKKYKESKKKMSGKMSKQLFGGEAPPAEPPTKAEPPPAAEAAEEGGRKCAIQ